MMNKDKVIQALKVITNEIDHYKNKPHFIELIEKITKEKNIMEEKIKNFVDTLTEEDYTKEINMIEKFSKKFEKKYIKKIETSDGIIYEYEKEFKFFPNKKSMHIENYFKDKFLKDTFDSIVIDNIKRNETSFDQNILTDIKYSNTCFIIIKK